MYARVQMCVSVLRACRGSHVRACVVACAVRVDAHSYICIRKVYMYICAVRVGYTHMYPRVQM